MRSPLISLSRLRPIGIALTVALVGSLPAVAMSEVDLDDNEYVIFHHHDALGSATATTGADGHVLWYEHSEPFGRSLGRLRTNGQSLDADPFGDVEEGGRSRVSYTGHVRDGASDLVYMQARHYDPELGRFLSNDPVGFDPSNPMSFNRYAYANNNPYSYVDPDGQQSVLLSPTGAGLAAGVGTSATIQSTGITNEAVSRGVRKAISNLFKYKGGSGLHNSEDVGDENDSNNDKRNSSEKAALVDMAKRDKKIGITAADVGAYGDLNDELPDPFPEETVRGPEAHDSGLPSSRAPHAHVGPVNHIPVTDVTREDLGLPEQNDE